MKAIIVVVGLRLTATPVTAMTGQEFLQAIRQGAEDETAAFEAARAPVC
jgi:hypothetical protein